MTNQITWKKGTLPKNILNVSKRKKKTHRVNYTQRESRYDQLKPPRKYICMTMVKFLSYEKWNAIKIVQTMIKCNIKIYCEHCSSLVFWGRKSICALFNDCLLKKICFNFLKFIAFCFIIFLKSQRKCNRCCKIIKGIRI